jgi:trimeric autotransporter adhesin
MRRFVTLVVLFLFAIPFGVSISGCKHNLAPIFCNGGDSGVIAGQATAITLQPLVYGISLNSGEIGQVQAPAATDCKGSSVSVGNYVYGTTDMTLADVNPSNGHLCAGTWNRNSGGGIPDFTVCNPTNKSGTAYIAASAEGVTSNPLPVFVHPIVTSIVLGSPSNNCNTDPTTACCPLATVNQITAPAYDATTCVSQNQTRQLVARVYAGTGANQTNISCLAGHLVFSAAASGTGSGSNVVTIDQNGVATAQQPGSVLINANISNSSSSAGYFSSCPPASIALSAPGFSGNAPITVNQNNQLPLSATVLDTHGNPITGLTLEYVSTTPITIPAGSNTITPALAGAASISAICQPDTCNPAPYNQIGLQGNGTPITSNSVDVVTPGTNSTVLYMASTQSQYVSARDFTQTSLAQPLLLPYLPNSMVISNDGASIYMGSSTALMAINAIGSLSITRTDLSSPGIVLAVSPDGTTLVLTDPVKQTISIESAGGGVISSYGGVATHAEFTPDNQTVYITAGNQLLIYSNITGWTPYSPATPSNTPVIDVAVTVPAVGAYFAGPVTTARGYCPITTLAGSTSATNVFYPPADTAAAITDRIAATNDGKHILGATVSPVPTVDDLHIQIPASPSPTGSIACPLNATIPPTSNRLTFTNTVNAAPLSSITASAITGVLPASDSSIAFITYTGSSGLLPAYAPAPSGLGTVSYVHLSGTATAPLIGVLSSDNSTLYVGTSGDNLVHVINRSTLTDSSTLAPGLTTPSGAPASVNLIVQKPRKTT